MSNLTGVTKYFSTANEGFTTTLTTTITAGAATVPLANMSSLTDGSVFVGIIEPGGINQQTFTGTVTQASTSITSVIWTRGTNVAHVGGVTIVDYVTGTDFNMMSKGIQQVLNQDTSFKSGLLIPSATLTTPTIASFTNAQHTHTNAAGGGKLTSSGITSFDTSLTTISNPYKFHVHAGSDYGSVVTGVYLTASLNTKDFDTNSNFNTTTFTYTVPVTGYYQINAQVQAAAQPGYYEGVGIRLTVNGTAVTGNANSFDNNTSFDTVFANVSDLLHLGAGDSLQLQGLLNFTTGAAFAANGTFMSGFLVSQT